jgi:AsmA-like protein
MQSLRKLMTLLRLLGWVVLALVVGIQFVERSGLATRWAEQWLSSRLGPLGAELELGEVDVHWLDPAVVLRDFKLEDRGELLAANELRLTFGLTEDGGVTVERVEVQGGRVRYGPALVHSLRGLFDLAPQDDPMPDPATSGPRPLPSLRVRDLALALEVPDGGSVPLGVLALDIDGRSTEDADLRGRFRLPARKGSRAPEVRIRGRAEPGGRLSLESWGDRIDLAAWQIPELAMLDPFAQLQARGTLSLSSTGVVSLTGEEDPRAELRLSLSGGAVVLPFEDHHIEEANVELELAYSPQGDERLWSRAAWTGRGELAGAWEGHRFQGGLRLGSWATPGTVFEQWTELESLPIGDPLLELLGHPKELETVAHSIDARGHVKLTAAVRCFDSWAPPEDPLPHLETIAVFADSGDVVAKWQGWPSRAGARPIGFPMPAQVSSAKGVFARTPRLARRNYLGLKVVGAHKGGPVDLQVYTWSPRVDMSPLAPGYGLPELDLLIESSGIAIDEDLRVALAELGEIQPALTAWDDYSPVGGVAAGQLRLSGRAEFPFPITHVSVQLAGVGLTPRLFPAQLDSVDGELEVLSNGVDEVAVRFDAEGQLAGGSRARLQGRLRAPAGRDFEDLPPAFEVAQLRADNIDFDGPIRSLIDEQLPGVGAVLRDYEPHGSADLHATLLRSPGSASREFEFRINPRGPVNVTPKAFPVRADAVRGRVFVKADAPIATSVEPRPPTVSTRVVALRGEWPSHITVSFRGEFPAGEPGSFRVSGAGLRLFASEDDVIRPTAFLRQLDREIAGPAGSGLIHTAELESISLLGSVDFQTDVQLSESAVDAAPGEHRFHVRGGRFAAGASLQLDDIGGRFDVTDGVVRGGDVSALFAGTQITADGFELHATDDGFALETDFRASNVPLDPEHLAILLDEATRRALFDELHWHGRLDVPQGHLAFTSSGAGRRETRLSGEVRLSDCFLDLGLPLSVRSARGRIENLVLDEGGVRGFGRIEDLYGQIAERELGPAQMLVSYHGSRLTIDELEGTFERGQVRGLAEAPSPAVRPATVLAVDLIEPFPFLLALELERVDVARLLEGVFASNIADRGDLNARLRLSGRLDDPLSLEGRGGGELTDTRLWSVPVFRDLFSQLGYDATAVFDSMSCNFQLQDGSVRLDQVDVHSPLFSLEGDGRLDLDGSLKMDLELRYALVDKVKILTSLVYLVQNTLLEVAIRGDLSRPQVFLQGALTRLFQDVDSAERGLPIPRPSSLPVRF